MGPRDRRCKSCRADQFPSLPWSNTSGIRLLSGTMQVELLPAAPAFARLRPGEPLPGSVKVARRPVKPCGVGASPTLAAILEGRQIQAGCTCFENRTGSSGVGALPTPSASSKTRNERKADESHHPLPKPVAPSPELPTQAGHPHPTGQWAEPVVPPNAARSTEQNL